MNSLISVIIVNWNKKQYLATCLETLFLNSEPIEVIVVDNGSADGSVEYIKKKYPKIKLVENQSNLGYAQANNQGFNISTGKFVLFLNNDTKVTRGFLKPLIKVLTNNKDVGGVQSKILLTEDKKKLDSIGAFFTNSGFLYHYGFRKKDEAHYDKQIDLYSAKGACMLFKREVLKNVLVDGEIFDSRYFAYFEETDFCHRVWLNNYKVVYIPESIVYHRVGATSSKLGNAFIQYHSFKNRINSYLKNLSMIYLLKILPLHLCLCLAASLSYLVRGQASVAFSIIGAILWNIFNLKTTLEKRRFIQSRVRKIDDEKFLNSLTKPVGIDYFIAHIKGLESFRSGNK